jgi:hypothetical protein
MYVRMADGRDHGQVLDMVEDVGRAMLANGQALPIDFSEPDPLGAREIMKIADSAEVPVATALGSASQRPGKPPAGHFKKKSSR